MLQKFRKILLQIQRFFEENNVAKFELKKSLNIITFLQMVQVDRKKKYKHISKFAFHVF